MDKRIIEVDVTKRIKLEIHMNTPEFKELQKENPNATTDDLAEIVAASLKKDNEWISGLGRVPNLIQFGNQNMIDIQPWSGFVILDESTIDTNII